MKSLNFYIPGILRFSIFLLLLIFSLAIIYTTNNSVQIVHKTAIEALTETARALFSSVENILRSNGETDFSNIRSIFSDNRTVAYALIAQKDGNIIFHTNPVLINTRPFSEQEMERRISTGTFTSSRIMLGTGVPAYEFNFVIYRSETSPMILRLVLQTTTADKNIQQAERMWWITGLLIVILWSAGIISERFFTNRIKTQAARENQKRLTLIGQMTASLAHEIRNALGSMKGYAQLLEERAVEGSPQKEALSMVVTGALRIESLVRELLLYSKEESYHIKSFELASLIAEALASSSPDCAAGIELNIPSSISVTGDWEKFLRVMVNGIKNALDSMREGGGKISINSYESSRWVSIHIEDTGEGILEKDQDRLFTPFYTTKTDGTGLGLAYSKKVVEGMGGTIRLTNRQGGGAILIIKLPNARKRRYGKQGFNS